jgi:hypothetical protein
LDLARTRSNLARRAAAQGAERHTSLMAADSELSAMETSLAQIETSLSQGQSAAVPANPAHSRNIPMKRALAITCTAIGLAEPAPAAAQPQQGVPIVEVQPASAKTAVTFGAPIGVRQVAGGKVLINDGGRRQIKLFDSLFTTSTLVSDSAPGSASSYGPYAVPLIPFIGDSSIVADVSSRTLVVLDGRGTGVRALTLPGDQLAIGSFIGGEQNAAGVDDKGRLLYRSNESTMMTMKRDDAGVAHVRVTEPPDSTSILRADLDTRKVDTVGRLMRSLAGGRMTVTRSTTGGSDLRKFIMNPLHEVDEWAMLSDGTIAIVRGHDYHVDWIHPDGTKSSTGKLPFDWKRLTDADKQKIVDSARAVQEERERVRAAINAVKDKVAAITAGGDPGGGGGGGLRGSGGQPGAGRGNQSPEITEFAPLNEIADYYPPIRSGGAKADFDGNLWILPTTSAQSKNGELVYDVVNPKRGLFERVRMPPGRSVLGFGKGGVVYLMSGDRTNGFYVERARLSPGPKVTP